MEANAVAPTLAKAERICPADAVALAVIVLLAVLFYLRVAPR